MGVCISGEVVTEIISFKVMRFKVMSLKVMRFKVMSVKVMHHEVNELLGYLCDRKKVRYLKPRGTY